MNNMLRKTIRGLDSVINFAVVVFLVLLLIIGLYVLWETKLVHTEASSKTWTQYKPTKKPTVTFDELSAANSDVIGWIDVYGTGVDYPVLYNQDIQYYIAKDPWKNNSSIGSIFMDSECSRDWHDFQSILYGHHMESHCMFGDLTLFNDNKFFDEHLYGDVYFNDSHHGLKIIGVIDTTADNKTVYATKVPRGNGRNYLNSLESLSTNWRDVDFNYDNEQILLMSTCADSTIENRCIVIAAITDETFENPFIEPINLGPGVDDLKGWLGFPWIAWFAGLVVIVMITIYTLWQVNNVKEKRKIERMVKNNDKFKNEKDK